MPKQAIEVLKAPSGNGKAAPPAQATAFVIRSLGELDDALKKMGRYGANVAKLTAARDEEIQAVTARYGKQILSSRGRYDELETACQAYAAEHRDELLAGQKTKTLKRPNGEVSFVAGRETIDLEDGADESAVIDQLEKKGFETCVTIKKSINKSVIKAQFDAVCKKVKGLILKTGEESVKIKPAPVS